MIHKAEIRLQITEIIKDFFLHAVSAKTEVGNSNNQTTRLETLVIITICGMESHTYVYKRVITGIKKVIPDKKFIRD
jgi:hypothetical protein